MLLINTDNADQRHTDYWSGSEHWSILSECNNWNPCWFKIVAVINKHFSGHPWYCLPILISIVIQVFRELFRISALYLTVHSFSGNSLWKPSVAFVCVQICYGKLISVHQYHIIWVLPNLRAHFKKWMLTKSEIWNHLESESLKFHLALYEYNLNIAPHYWSKWTYCWCCHCS